MMAADMHIHVLTDKFTEHDFRVFFASQAGSKWSPMTDFWKRRDAGEITDGESFQTEWRKVNKEVEQLEDRTNHKWGKMFEKFDNESPNIWIGEVSWLKAGFFADPESYIPDTVSTIDDLIGEDWPVLDDELIKKILAAFDLENSTNYRLAEVGEVAEFLQEHKGSKVFTISW